MSTKADRIAELRTRITYLENQLVEAQTQADSAVEAIWRAELEKSQLWLSREMENPE